MRGDRAGRAGRAGRADPDGRTAPSDPPTPGSGTGAPGAPEGAAGAPGAPAIPSVAERPRGILDVPPDRLPFDLARRAPHPALTPFVEYHWIVTWDRRDLTPHLHRGLPDPGVQLSVDPRRSGIFGVTRGRFTYLLRDAGRVLGVRFRAAGFRPFLGSPVSALTDRTAALDTVLGAAGAEALEHAVRGPGGQDDVVAAADAALLAVLPARDPVVETVTAMVELVAADPSITRVDDLAGRLGTSPRVLQRRFAEYVGVGPKWVIRRYRLQEAAGRAAAGTATDWAALAAALGYSDQAHLTRDFTAMVGSPPARYARDCAAAAGRGAPPA